MKKISVAFDGLKFSNSTLNYAIEVAAGSKAFLSGVFLDDFLYHSYPVTDIYERAEIQRIDVRAIEQQDKNINQRSMERFESVCSKSQLAHVIHHNKSFAIDDLLKETIYSDLLVIGKNETFSHFKELVPTTFLRNLLVGTQCPVIVVPEEYRKTEKVILLYDGKPSSVFAIKMFNYMMPWMRELKTEVVSVMDPKGSLELPDDPLIKEFVKCHYPDAEYTLLQGDPEIEIPAYLKNNCQNSLVVLGAYQRNQVSRWLKTSMADILIQILDMPLFIAHPR
jgi:hypothetical protein